MKRKLSWENCILFFSEVSEHVACVDKKITILKPTVRDFVRPNRYSTLQILCLQKILNCHYSVANEIQLCKHGHPIADSYSGRRIITQHQMIRNQPVLGGTRGGVAGTEVSNRLTMDGKPACSGPIKEAKYPWVIAETSSTAC